MATPDSNKTANNRSGPDNNKLVFVIKRGYVAVEAADDLAKNYSLNGAIKMMANIAARPFFMRAGKPIHFTANYFKIQIQEEDKGRAVNFLSFPGFAIHLSLIGNVDLYQKCFPELPVFTTGDDGDIILFHETMVKYQKEAETVENFVPEKIAVYAAHGMHDVRGLQEIVSLEETRMAEIILSTLSYLAYKAHEQKLMRDSLGNFALMIKSSANPEIGIYVLGTKMDAAEG